MTSHLSARWSGLSKRQQRVVQVSAAWIALFVAYLGFGIFTVITDPTHRVAGIVVVFASLVVLATEILGARTRFWRNA